MLLDISTTSGKVHHLNVEPNSTILELKLALTQATGFSVEQQVILFHGALLNDTATLEAMRVQDGIKLHMVVNLDA
jgi:hypothetical protein